MKLSKNRGVCSMETWKKVICALLVLIFLNIQAVSAANENSVVTEIIVLENGDADVKIELTIPDMDQFTDTAQELQYNEYAIREDLEESLGMLSDMKISTDIGTRKIKVTAKAVGFSMNLGDVWKISATPDLQTSQEVLTIELPPNVKILKLEPRPSRTLSDRSFMWMPDSGRIYNVEIIYETTFVTWLKTKGLTASIFVILIGGIVLVGRKKLTSTIQKRTGNIDDKLDDLERKLEMK